MIRPDFRQIKHSNELYHYGMPRRSGRYPWGSGDRPYQSVKNALKGKSRSEYFTSERTIPKGTKVFRTVSKVSSDVGKKNKSTYITYLETDRDLYRTGHIRERDKAKTSYEYEMILKGDLKIPSRQTFIDSIKNVLDTDPTLLEKSVNAYFDVAYPKGSKRDNLVFNLMLSGNYDYNYDKVWSSLLKTSYSQVKDLPVKETWGQISVGLGKNDKMKDAIIKDLKSKGYNAMVDEAGVGGSGKLVEGIDPLIVFDSSILDVKNVSEIDEKQEIKSEINYSNWRTKSRRNAEKW